MRGGGRGQELEEDGEEASHAHAHVGRSEGDHRRKDHQRDAERAGLAGGVHAAEDVREAHETHARHHGQERADHERHGGEQLDQPGHEELFQVVRDCHRPEIA
jgi:hypothetical protein